MKIQKIKTVFRQFPDGEIIALFPYEIVDDRCNCLAYAHTGQHGAANYTHVINTTKPAKDAQKLKRELESIGYEIQEIQMISRPKLNEAIKLFIRRYTEPLNEIKSPIQ